MKQYIGTCSICGGDVAMETVFWMVGPPPPPKCEKCGAEAMTWKPVIPMKWSDVGPQHGLSGRFVIDFNGQYRRLP